jgi:hypothetical protein
MLGASGGIVGGTLADSGGIVGGMLGDSGGIVGGMRGDSGGIVSGEWLAAGMKGGSWFKRRWTSMLTPPFPSPFPPNASRRASAVNRPGHQVNARRSEMRHQSPVPTRNGCWPRAGR